MMRNFSVTKSRREIPLDLVLFYVGTLGKCKVFDFVKHRQVQGIRSLVTFLSFNGIQKNRLFDLHLYAERDLFYVFSSSLFVVLLSSFGGGGCCRDSGNKEIILI